MRLRLLGAAAAALGLIVTADAALVNYAGLTGAAAGSVNGVSDNASDWSTSWEDQNPGSLDYVVTSAASLLFGGLTTSAEGAAINGGGSFESAGRGVGQRGFGQTWDALGRVSDPFGGGSGQSNIDQGVVWWSFLARVNEPITSWDQARVSLHESNIPWFAGGSDTHLQVRTIDGNSKWGIGLFGGADMSLGRAVVIGEPVLFVGKLELSLADGQNHAFVWSFTDPVAASLGGPDLSTATAHASLVGLNSTDLRFKSLGLYLDNAPNRVTVDEFRFGTTYESVTPVAIPEASPLALLTIFVVSAGARSYWRRRGLPS